MISGKWIQGIRSSQDAPKRIYWRNMLFKLDDEPPSPNNAPFGIKQLNRNPHTLSKHYPVSSRHRRSIQGQYQWTSQKSDNTFKEMNTLWLIWDIDIIQMEGFWGKMKRKVARRYVDPFPGVSKPRHPRTLTLFLFVVSYKWPVPTPRDTKWGW
jgi:hypothetical protein